LFSDDEFWYWQAEFLFDAMYVRDDGIAELDQCGRIGCIMVSFVAKQQLSCEQRGTLFVR
jgi:hypothetical protein